MKYVSIDIETTGLDPEVDQILEIAAVIEDTSFKIPVDDLPALRLLLHYDRIVGQPMAIAMNADLIREISQGKNLTEPKDVGWIMADFLYRHGYSYGGTVNVAGKNFAMFDQQFLNRLPGFNGAIKIHRRIIDPSILYWEADDTVLPSLQICLDKAGIKTTVTHSAVDDARDVIRVLRHKGIGHSGVL